MMTASPRVRLALTILPLLAAPAAAQEAPGDAEFCRSYAATTAIVAEDAIRISGACQDFGRGVHGVETMHRDWCSRTPRSSVEGAAVHIRRLASQCTKGALARPADYGGYDIAGNEAFERQYGEARGWRVLAAFSGRTFMYCAAIKDVGHGDVRLGVDRAEPGAGAQWQLAVPVKAPQDWRGALEADGRGFGNGGGNQASGTARDGWAIAWLTMADVDGLRQGKEASLSVGKETLRFSLDGAAAALTKVEECAGRQGATAAAQRSAPAGEAADASSARVAHPFDIQVSTSPKAQAKLRKIDEKVKIIAVYSGEPVPAKAKLASEVGEIGLGDEEAVLPLNGGNARLKGELPRKKLGWVKQPRLLINVVSARRSFPDNLLDCELFDDQLELAQKRSIEIHCKLIGE